jgi:FixJ family two-component response regulator
MLEVEIEKHIKKLNNPLKKEDELKEILKRRLTKKELKILLAWADNQELTPLLEKLNIDSNRYDSIRENIIKKLNQEKLKQEITI